jgi:hypothetical protein
MNGVGGQERRNISRSKDIYRVSANSSEVTSLMKVSKPGSLVWRCPCFEENCHGWSIETSREHQRGKDVVSPTTE